jgi:O-antigen ligase
MIRLSLLALYVAFFGVYAFKSWYRSLCALILLMAVLEHPDMPKTLLGIQGLNPWNVLFLCVLAGFALQRRRERLTWDLPRHLSLALLAYLVVVLVGFARMLIAPAGLGETRASMISEYLINTVKWTVPGLLLFLGCRSRQRLVLGLIATLGIYFFLALLVIRWMPASTILSGEQLSARSQKILLNEIGYHRVNLSTLLAGASWAVFVSRGLASRRRRRTLVLGLAALILYAQALTAGRAGYATWVAVGLSLSLLRSRRYLLIIPGVVALVLALVPAARERMLQGFSGEERHAKATPDSSPLGDEAPDDYTITAGRTLIWPYVVAKIEESPLFGHGRQAMVRTGLARFLREELRESFPHPHNAYLEWLLDNGWLGLALMLPFYLAVLWHALILFRDPRSPVFVAAGGAALALVLALLFGSIGSQTFYPREGAVGMWCAIGLMLRASVERARALRAVRARAAPPVPAPDSAIAWYPPRPRRLPPGSLDAEMFRAG